MREKREERCQCGGKERRERGGVKTCVGVPWQVFEEAESRWWEEAVTFPPQRGFPGLPPLPRLSLSAPPHPFFSLPESPSLRLRCPARVTPQHCSVISGPTAASPEPTDWTWRSERREEWPSTSSFSAKQSPFCPASRGPFCLWRSLRLLQKASVPSRTCCSIFARCYPDHISPTDSYTETDCVVVRTLEHHISSPPELISLPYAASRADLWWLKNDRSPFSL